MHFLSLHPSQMSKNITLSKSIIYKMYKYFIQKNFKTCIISQRVVRERQCQSCSDAFVPSLVSSSTSLVYASLLISFDFDSLLHRSKYLQAKSSFDQVRTLSKSIIYTFFKSFIRRKFKTFIMSQRVVQ